MSPSDAVAQGMWGQQSGGAVNPQELNRYSYVNNNPVKYTDPTGHCIGPVIVICIAAGGAAATKAAAAAGAVIVGAFVVAGAWIAGDELRKAHAAAANEGKPLTSADEKMMKRIGSIPEFLKDHPDLEDEAKAVNNGETLGQGKDHVKEADQQVNMLRRAVKHLERMYDLRDKEGQDKIEESVRQANQYIKQLEDILNAK